MSDITFFYRWHMVVDKSLFEPLESKRSFEEISSNIKSLIFSGALKPGDRLPSEIELAKQYKVGRQTMREAFRILELSGLLTVQKGYGGGPIIHDNIMERISDMILDAMDFIDEQTGQFFNSRDLQVSIEGNNNTLLHLPVPIIAITELIINGDEE